jgi:hypothetical protein
MPPVSPGPAARALRFFLVLAGVALAQSALAEGGSLFIDPLDGAFDVDRWLSSRYGFVPIVTPITEPAVGYGAAAGLVFIHGRPPELENGEGGGERAKRVQPSLSAAMAMATSNGSWAAAGGHLGHWKDGRVRYLGGGGYASLQLSAFTAEDTEVEFQLEAVPLIQDLTFTIPGTELGVGARYVLAATKVRLDRASAGAVPDRDLEVVLSGLGPVLRWDGRDSIFSPSRGVRAEISATWFAPWLGSDRDYWQARVKEVSYAPLAPWLVGALRLDVWLSGGDEPFWARPYVSLRGVPALRYQGDHVLVAETEERIDFGRRWSAVVFGGVGTTAGVARPTLAWGAGGGFRYLLARQFGIRAGLDVARGPEEAALYVIFGNAWY